MEAQFSPESQWVIFDVNNCFYAVPALQVMEMRLTGKVSSVPGQPSHVRGVMSFRGRMVPLIDLRLRLGMRSKQVEIDEFGQMLAQRKRDHQIWLDELEKSVREHREFSLTTDPHRCAFGRWYDAYEPETYALSLLTQKFDEPHKKIHAIASEVKQWEQKGKIKKAQALIRACRHRELATMVDLFALMRDEIAASFREIAIVYEIDGAIFSFTVDAVHGVDRLILDHSENEHDRPAGSSLVSAVAHRPRSSSLTFILNDRAIHQQGRSRLRAS